MGKIAKTLKKDWILLLLILAGFCMSIYFYPALPDRVPSHWNIHGEIDGYMNRFWGAFLMPLMNAGFYFFFIFLPYLDPRKNNYNYFSSAYRAIRYMLHIFFVGIQIVTLMAALGYPIKIQVIVPAGVSLLFILLGNVMGKVKHNYFVGIRTPWTLSNEEVWRKTHRLAGPLWVAGGILCLILSFLNSRITSMLFFLVIVIIAAVPTVYSYILFRNDMNGK
ncbi:immunity protein SdpI [Oxobacter pfennigii]|uniref:Immunity protein SdpI n=1 Tax=Oxobacter pfennigii TaxID=36849 RepID=A0A0P8W5F2_9CLOT|nr:SdpI family protein [Oxobacter pfennigii]KPU43148.1 immunity protein SdpI [Oxobacter pfennigii]